MVIFERLVIRIAYDAHHGLHESLTRAQVPVLEARDQIAIEIGLLVKHVHNFVASTRHSRRVHHAQCIKYLIHTRLVFVHRAHHPHVVVMRRDAVLGRERNHRGHALQAPQLLWELVLNKNAALGGAKVCSALSELLSVERFVNNADSGASVDRDTDHTRNVVQVALCEALGAVERVDPDDHLFFEELIGKLVVVVVGFRRGHAVDLLHFLQVAAIAVPLHVVILNEHLLTDVALVELVGHDVRALCRHHVLHFVFFANNRRSRVQLCQVVHDCVLDVHVDLGEHVRRARALLHCDVGETGHFAHSVDHLVCAFQQLDARGEKLVQLHNPLHF
mmetsp:Transcript_39638/g.51945  ORF Transcript_39638/g.51945 Transcript_39638/m.51945 type:complete len:333 (-) Transcript_39638:8-1006(-)